MAVEISASGAAVGPFKYGSPKLLFHPPSSEWEVANDGKRFLAFTPVAPEGVPAPPTPITVVLNWTAGLKK
jgi:hypothetical protein